MSSLRRINLSSLIIAVTLCFTSNALAQTIVVLRVDASASTGGDGELWSTSFRYLQDALDEASASAEDDNLYQIWVAAGTYYPDESEYTQRTAGDRTESFHLHDFVALYGGFEGDESDLEERDPALNETILSGDLSGDDNLTEFLAGDYDTYDDNSFHVIFSTDVGPSAVIDGFTIRGGNANGSSNATAGAGMFVATSAPTISNCIFKANRAIGNGGAIENISSNPVIRDSQFLDNVGYLGGAIRNLGSSPIVVGCVFERNKAQVGGAQFAQQLSDPVMVNWKYNRKLCMTA